MFNNQNGIKRVAIYCRVSTDEQVQYGNGLDMQKEALMNYINIHKNIYSFNEKHTYIDEGKSGANKDKKDRPKLYEMFNHAQKGEFDIVLVWKIDRFFRKTLFLLEGIEALEQLGVGFISITQPFDTTQAFGKMMLQMMGVIAELERELIKERTHSGILSSMKKGKWGRGLHPFGYQKNTLGFLEIHEEDSKVVRLIFDLLIKKGLAINEIAKHINNLGIETHGSKGKLGAGRKEKIKHTHFWHRGVIHKILTNEIYYGLLIQNRYTQDKVLKKRVEKPKDEWIVSNIPGIIKKETFLRAQEQLQKNNKYSQRNKKNNRVYMLGGLMKDKENGYSYSGYTSSKGTINYRILMGKEKSKEYIAPSGISGNKIETLVWSKIKSLLLKPELLDYELSKINNYSNESQTIKEISILEENIASLETKNNNIVSLIDDISHEDRDIIKSTLNKNRATIDLYKSNIEKLHLTKISDKEKAQQLKDLKTLSKKLRHIIEEDKVPYQTKTLLCRNLISSILIKDENVEITMIVPDTRKREKGDYRKTIVQDIFSDSSNFIQNQNIHQTNNASLQEESVELCHNIGGASGIGTHVLEGIPSTSTIIVYFIYFQLKRENRQTLSGEDFSYTRGQPRIL